MDCSKTNDVNKTIKKFGFFSLYTKVSGHKKVLRPGFGNTHDLNCSFLLFNIVVFNTCIHQYGEKMCLLVYVVVVYSVNRG